MYKHLEYNNGGKISHHATTNVRQKDADERRVNEKLCKYLKRYTEKNNLPNL